MCLFQHRRNAFFCCCADEATKQLREREKISSSVSWHRSNKTITFERHNNVQKPIIWFIEREKEWLNRVRSIFYFFQPSKIYGNAGFRFFGGHTWQCRIKIVKIHNLLTDPPHTVCVSILLISATVPDTYTFFPPHFVD